MNRNHIPALDGLRGFAALVVLVSHFSNMTGIFGYALGRGAGQYGVMIFFVLSGFLMSHLYFDRPITRDSAKLFMKRRFARVVPLYVFVVFMSFAITNIAPNSRMIVYNIKDWGDVASHLLLVRGTAILWTIVVEIRYYVLVPFIWWAYRHRPAQTIYFLWVAIIMLFVWQFLEMLFPHLEQASRNIAMFRFVRALPFFFAGNLIALYFKNKNQEQIGLLAKTFSYNFLFIASLCSVLLLFPNLRPFSIAQPAFESSNLVHRLLASVVDARWGNPLSLFAVCALLWFSIKAQLAALVFGNSVSRFFGNISYSLYILHSPVLVIVAKYTGWNNTNLPMYMLVTLPLILIISLLSYKYIENPIRRWINSKPSIKFVP